MAGPLGNGYTRIHTHTDGCTCSHVVGQVTHTAHCGTKNMSQKTPLPLLHFLAIRAMYKSTSEVGTPPIQDSRLGPKGFLYRERFHCISFSSEVPLQPQPSLNSGRMTFTHATTKCRCSPTPSSTNSNGCFLDHFQCFQ